MVLSAAWFFLWIRKLGRFPGCIVERANGLPLLLEEAGDGGLRRVG